MRRRERPVEPPTGPTPNWTCPMCETPVMSGDCPRCNLSEEEAEETHEYLMESRIEQFKDLLEEQDVFNFGMKQVREVDYEGQSLKVRPGFRVSIDDLLRLPGVHDVTVEPSCAKRDESTWLLIRYEPDDTATEDELSRFIESVQMLANRHGPTRCARMVTRFMDGDDEWDERYDADSAERLAVKNIVQAWEYER